MNNLLLALLMIPVGCFGGASVLDPLSWIRSQVDSARGLYVTFGEDNHQLLVRLKEEKAALEAQEPRVEETIKATLEKVSEQIALIKDKLKEGRSDFLQRKIAVLNEMQQTLIDIQLTRKQAAINLEQQIKVLEEYLKDPQFKSLTIDTREFYSFENLQSISQKLVDEQELIDHLEEQKSNLLTDLESRTNSVDQLEKEARAKEHDLKERKYGFEELPLDTRQRQELLELHVKLLNHKRKLMEQKVVEIKRKLSFLETKLLTERTKRKVYEEQRASIKEGLRVDEGDVAVERATLEKKRQAHLESRDKLYIERKNLELERDKLKKSLEEYAKKLNITVTDLQSLDTMAVHLKSLENYYDFSLLLNIKEQIAFLEKKIEFDDAHIKLYDAMFERDRLAVSSIESWNKLTMRRFRTEGEVEVEIAKYQDPIKEADLEIASLTEKRTAATNVLNQPLKVIQILEHRSEQYKKHEKIFLQMNPVAYYRSLEYLAGAQGLANRQIETSRKIIEDYSKAIQLRNDIKTNAQMIVDELQSVGLRPPHAISFEGLRNIITDLIQAKNELVNLGSAYVSHCTPALLIKKLAATGFFGFLWFIVKLFLLFFVFLLVRFVLPLFSAFVHRVTRDAGTGLLLVGRFLEGVIEFVEENYTVLFLWLCTYLALHHDVVCELFPRILYYLASIPLVLWMGRKAIRFFITYNKEQAYLFVSEPFVDRIASICKILLYATGTIFLFREAFMLASYTKSELPTILLALYSVIVRIVLISLVRKEDILEIMPEKGVFWQWARTHVEEHFYSVYAAIVALFILSEPHIGFGKQISYLLWGVVGTLLLLRGVLLLHEFIKRTSSLLFFAQDTEQYRERFSHAQKLYGMFIIGTFIVIAFFAVIVGAKIWGYNITYADIYDLFNKELFALGEGTIDRREITLISILQLLTYFFGSFVVAWAVNQLVLRRIYDLLIIEPGVQHTVSTLVHYLIILTIIMLGFQRIGLGKVVPVLLLSLAIAIYWPLRDHVNDFVSYFIILVQRPFKIGDYVQIDEKVQGVVRKITPRSVIVREKNSVTVLVPNSKVITGTISNWNYVRSFVATPDLFVSVGYAADPQEVRTLLHRVLDASIHVLKNPRPIIRLDDFGEQGFVFLVRPFISVDNVPQRLDIASDLRFGFVKVLRERGIEVMPPARIMRVKND